MTGGDEVKGALELLQGSRRAVRLWAALLTMLAGCTEPDRSLASIEILPASSSLRVADRVQVTAVVRDRSGQEDPTARVAWSSSDPGVLTVDSTVLLVAEWPGSAEITARSGDLIATLAVAVHTPIAAITLDIDTLTLVIGDERVLRASASDSTGLPVARALKTRITSSNHAVATVRAPATVVGWSTGEAKVTLDVEGIVREIPVRVGAIVLTTVARGDGFSCGLSAKGEAVCWGRNRSFQTGVETPLECGGSAGQYCGHKDQLLPAFVQTSLRFRSISVGREHACAVTAENRAYCWGNNSFRQLGATTSRYCSTLLGAGGSCSAVPLPVEGSHDFVFVSAGGSHSCGLTADGKAYCWGWALESARTQGPTLVPGGHVFRQVSAGLNGSCAVTTSGAGYCWGFNSAGEMGMGTWDGSAHHEPVAVTGGLTFSEVHRGGAGSCGLTTDGEAYCWGADHTLGQAAPELCTKTSPSGVDMPCAPYPVRVSTASRFTSLSASVGLSCGLTVAGAAECWGWFARNPGAVAGVSAFKNASAGWYSGCGVAIDGVAWCWTSPGAATKVAGQP